MDAEEVINRTVCKSIKHVTAFPGRLNEEPRSENPLCLEPDIRMWKIPLKISTPMEFSNFSYEKPAFFFFFAAESISVLGTVCYKLGLFNSEFSWVTFGSNVGDLLCSSHLFIPPPAPCLVMTADAGSLGKYLGTPQLPHQTPFAKKKNNKTHCKVGWF